MKYFIIINRILVITTFISFVGIWTGFIAEVILGIYQIACSLAFIIMPMSLSVYLTLILENIKKELS